MKRDELRGLLVPALTPFGPELQPSADAATAHCRWLLQQGADGLAVFGTTSEANSLSCEERMELLQAMIEGGVPAGKFLPGTGACALSDAVRLTRHAVASGCAGVLMLPPFYYKNVSDDGLYASFSEVMERVGDSRLRVYLYHIPPVSGVPISLELIQRLVDDYPQTLAGVKDSGGDFEYTAELIRRFPGLSIFPGSEVFLLDGLRHGGAGCITATGNVNPAGIRAVLDHWQEAGADGLQDGITRVRQLIQSYPMIPALKAIVAEHGDDPGWRRVRPPLTALDEATARKLLTELDGIGFSMDGGAAAAA